MSKPNAKYNPLEVPSENTAGEDTERNYRYQHAYGAILLIGAACKKLPYISIYAEHHEDILGERDDSLFDGYQIKTRKPEDGVWDLADTAVKKSIKNFVNLYKKFPSAIGELKFVSNVGYSSPAVDIKDQTKLRRSPLKFLEVVQASGNFGLIAKPYAQTFDEIREFCECTSQELFETLTRMQFVRGPERSSFDAEIVTDHLALLPECVGQSVEVLSSVRDELIRKVWLASHSVNDSSRHWLPAGIISPSNPTIFAKRVPVNAVYDILNQKVAPSFLFRSSYSVSLGNGKGNLWKLRKKMERGKLHSQIETMERRSISAEQSLIEHANRRPEDIERLLTQLEGIVQGECDEAFHTSSITEDDFGPQMLKDVYARLREKANVHSKLVFDQPYEMLIGMAGLLTGECKVWWSQPFNLEDEQ